MAAINVVRFRVKPGRENEFVDAHRNMKDAIPGMRRAWLVNTGDRGYCIVGVFKDKQGLVAARPAMIANLDKVRGCLEDLGGGLGVTDPVSGEVTVELGGKEGKGGREGKKARDPEKRAAKAKRAEERRAKKGDKGDKGNDPDRRAAKAKRAEKKRAQGKAQ